MDYSKTVHLPKTDFPMKADLPHREPEILRFWEEGRIYQKLLERRSAAPPFVLHDGPPYANGHIHIGHALNRILKDMVVKSKAMAGFRTPFVPGWDCHGLPIEQQLMQELKMDRRQVRDLPEFRGKARAFAERFLKIQREEFKRLGELGDWEHPYATMHPAYEAEILRALRILVEKGYLYRGLKSVYWCGECETALAEAEIEYKEKTSPSAYVKFPVASGSPFSSKVRGPLSVLIWTTTPWTLPANVGLAFHPELSYVLVRCRGRSLAGEELLILAQARLDAVMRELAIERHEVVEAVGGKKLESLLCRSPLESADSRGLLADYVSAQEGTGVVHTAPGHGREDFETGQRYGLPVVCPVDGKARFTEEAGKFRGLHVFKEGNAAVARELERGGFLMGQAPIVHSYPHCWRCKEPILFRATKQWFLSVAHQDLRSRLLKEVGRVRWIPPLGEARIRGMLEGRPDWCLSRQRFWGTPIPAVYCKKCGEPVLDPKLIGELEKKVAREGSDFWFGERPLEALSWKGTCGLCGGGDFEAEKDILDVWVDSGCSWLSVLKEGTFPADLYLEGSDQHRGWFQSSLVLSYALQERAPYRTVLTHGFVLDDQGRAMHKSLGNVVSPQTVVERWGADLLRLWVAFSDWKEDVRLSEKLLEGPRESYRRIRNLLRYLLGNLNDFSSSEEVPHAELLDLDRWMLHRLNVLTSEVRQAYEQYDFQRAIRALNGFCVRELSSFYLDILKDRLYTYPARCRERRSAQTVLYELLSSLLRLLAPVLSFTAEEAWRYFVRLPAGSKRSWASSVFLEDLPAAQGTWEDLVLDQEFRKVWELREKAYAILEQARRDKRIRAFLEARVVLRGGTEEEKKLLERFREHWPSFLIVSQVELGDSPGQNFEVTVEKASGRRCARCWQWKEDLGQNPAFEEVCSRCAQALS
ncbi:MAG: isoleucine--tRNA ligase [Elusimicrobia bacterium]|nr:isoleucine--tRNA ligase [Elusimicrobiota bacterium]